MTLFFLGWGWGEQEWRRHRREQRSQDKFKSSQGDTHKIRVISKAFCLGFLNLSLQMCSVKIRITRRLKWVLCIRIRSDPSHFGQVRSRSGIQDLFEKKHCIFYLHLQISFKMVQFVFDFIHISFKNLYSALKVLLQSRCVHLKLGWLGFKGCLLIRIRYVLKSRVWFPTKSFRIHNSA